MEGSTMERSIGRLEGKVDLILTDMSKLRGSFETLEAGRLTRLEEEVSGLIVKMGVATAVISIVLSVASAYFIHLVFKL